MMEGTPGTPELTSGASFGKYRLVRKLGEGAFGTVYEALLPGPMGFTKRYAIKKIRSQLIEGDPRFVQSMVNEARIGGLLSHPNVVQIFKFEELDGQHVLVMEYVEGPTFRTLVDHLAEQGRTLPPGIVAEVGVQICRALTHAIERKGVEGQPMNLVHRDLKPENVILAPAGLVKVLDFGIARSTANLYLTTTMNLTRGTPCYMSPEQLRGEDLDGRSDLFALGCLLYELLMGEVLFQEAGFKLVQLVLEGDLSASFAVAHQKSPTMTAIIARLLERPLRKRYQNAMEVELALAQVARAEAVHPDLANISRIVAAGQLPSWDGEAPAAAQPVIAADGPPSGKAGGFWDQLKAWLGI